MYQRGVYRGDAGEWPELLPDEYWHWFDGLGRELQRFVDEEQDKRDFPDEDAGIFVMWVINYGRPAPRMAAGWDYERRPQPDRSLYGSGEDRGVVETITDEDIRW